MACSDGDINTVDDFCFEGVCSGTSAAGHRDDAVHARTLRMNTYSHGGGFNPATGMYVYPQWSGSTFYTFDADTVHQGSFSLNSGYNQIMQVWYEPDGSSMYTANWNHQRCQRLNSFSRSLEWNSVVLGFTVGGVTADQEYVYCFANTGGTFAVLDKDTGEVKRHGSLSFNNLGSTTGGVAMVDTGSSKKLYYGSGRDLYRFDVHNNGTLAWDGFHFVTDVTISNMAFNGIELCISSVDNDASIVYCYQILSQSLYYDKRAALVPSPVIVRIMSVATRSHGAGYFLPLHEYWYPQWDGQVIHRNARSLTYLDSFSVDVRSITQIWSEADGSFYVASNSDQSVVKYSYSGGFPTVTRAWRQDMKVAMGGVASDGQYVYAMPRSTNKVFVLDSSSGDILNQFSLEVKASDTFNALWGGLAVVKLNGMSYLFHADATNRQGHRYRVGHNATMGTFDGMSFYIEDDVYNALFDGQDWCISPNSNSVKCYRLLTANVYGIQAGVNSANLQLFAESKILSDEQRRQLSVALSNPGHATQWKLCFSGEADGFSSSNFHSKCNNKGPTLTVARTNGRESNLLFRFLLFLFRTREGGD